MACSSPSTSSRTVHFDGFCEVIPDWVSGRVAYKYSTGSYKKDKRKSIGLGLKKASSSKEPMTDSYFGGLKLPILVRRSSSAGNKPPPSVTGSPPSSCLVTRTPPTPVSLPTPLRRRTKPTRLNTPIVSLSPTPAPRSPISPPVSPVAVFFHRSSEKDKDREIERIPLRACCPGCLSVIKQCTDEGEKWEIKFSRGAKRIRDVQKLQDFDDHARRPSVEGLNVRVDEVGAVCLSGADDEVEDLEDVKVVGQEEVDEEDLFPLPSPKRSPATSPNPSPSASSTHLNPNSSADDLLASSISRKTSDSTCTVPKRPKCMGPSKSCPLPASFSKQCVREVEEEHLPFEDDPNLPPPIHFHSTFTACSPPTSPSQVHIQVQHPTPISPPTSPAIPTSSKKGIQRTNSEPLPLQFPPSPPTSHPSSSPKEKADFSQKKRRRNSVLDIVGGGVSGVLRGLGAVGSV